MLIINIDYREQKILKIINPSIQIVVSDIIYGPVKHNNIEFYYKISNLVVGDFILKNSECTDDSIYYIIERKSINDLSSSIIDGRFREQKERLADTNNEIIYIIEGKMMSRNSMSYKSTSKYNTISNTTIKSSIINLQIKHKYNVFRTECENDTLDYLVILYKKINESNGNDFKKVIPTTIKKKSNSSSIYINQLMMLYGVSKNTALKIYELYPTFFSLIDAYKNKTEKECENLLADIILTPQRKLGKALSKKIYHQLYDKTSYDLQDNVQDNDQENDQELIVDLSNQSEVTCFL